MLLFLIALYNIMKKNGQKLFTIKIQLSENLGNYTKYIFCSLTIIDKINIYKLYIFSNFKKVKKIKKKILTKILLVK